MRKRQKQLHRVDDIHKPKPFLRFRLRVVVAFFIICMLACLVYYMIPVSYTHLRAHET